MKLISLNVWGARAGLANLLDFFKKHADVDVFCLQEMWNGGEHLLGKTIGGVNFDSATAQLLAEIQAVLPNHVSHFRPQYVDYYGLAIFVKKGVEILEEGELFVYKERGYHSPATIGDHARNIQYVHIATKNGPRTIINFHGLWNGQGKSDTPDRLLQSDNIISFIKNLTVPTVLCGDFNLMPTTESLKKFETFGLTNLIKENNITSTRTSFYKKEHRFADYTFVSQDSRVLDFKVLPDEVSDHNAMYLEFA